MRFQPESLHGANAGLDVARELMEPIKKQFEWISYGDLWTLGGVAAVQARFSLHSWEFILMILHHVNRKWRVQRFLGDPAEPTVFPTMSLQMVASLMPVKAQIILGM
jgi:hypothetical protein